jgi:hypothetical protein
LELIGTIVRLQVQEASLKLGERPRRWYDPAPLRTVPALGLDQRGVTGWTERGERVADVHHRDHPASKSAGGVNGISIGFTSHYVAMRRRFGTHLADGIAGENILVDTTETIGEEALAGGIVLETTAGRQVRLGGIMVAEPCVEFSRFALRHPEDAPSDTSVTEALTFLRHGTRGFYATLDGQPVTVRVGDLVYRV